MVTVIYKMNESIKAYEDIKAKIQRIKDAFYNELEGLEGNLKEEGERFEHFKALNDKGHFLYKEGLKS